MTHFLLIRHADNDLLQRRILAGRLAGVHLNARGRRQAADLAQALGTVPIEAIYSSPLERARETAEPLSIRSGKPIHLHPALNEIEFGAWTGAEFERLAGDPHWKAFNTLRSLTRTPGGETIFDVQTRMLTAIEALGALHPEGLVVIVGHGDPLKTVLAHCLGMPLDFVTRLHIDPAAVSILHCAAGGPEVLGVNLRPGSFSDPTGRRG